MNLEMDTTLHRGVWRGDEKNDIIEEKEEIIKESKMVLSTITTQSSESFTDQFDGSSSSFAFPVEGMGSPMRDTTWIWTANSKAKHSLWPLHTRSITRVVRAHFSKTIGDMVMLVVATTIDPASIGPVSALLSMPGWYPGPLLQDMSSFTNRAVRLLKHDKSIVREDHLDKRCEEATGEVVDEVIFFSKHMAASNRPVLTVHPIGVPHLRQDKVPPAGGKPGWAAPPNRQIGPWLRLLKAIAESHNLIPEFERNRQYRRVLEEAGYCPSHCFIFNEVSAVVIEVSVGRFRAWWRSCSRSLEQRIMVKAKSSWELVVDIMHHGIWISFLKGGVWVGHLLSGYSLPMEDLGQSKQTNVEGVGGTWREAIKLACETTNAAFPGVEVMAHLDHNELQKLAKKCHYGLFSEAGH
ncbi:unnamed protein product [Camellia sinensis]